MGFSDHLETHHYTASKAAFDKLPQNSYYPASQMHFCSMIKYFKSFEGQVKRAGMFIHIIVNGCLKIPQESLSSLYSYLNATDNTLKLFDHCVYLYNQIDMGSQIDPARARISLVGSGLSAISSFHLRVSNRVKRVHE